MGVNGKGKRKITVAGKLYWWTVREDTPAEPVLHIIADDHTLVARCSLYCPRLVVEKDNTKGARDIPVPGTLAGQYLVFCPQYVAALVRLAL